ncbi:MAG: ribosome-associated translation inhibitor RaiA [Phyllobacteriaceae bacterium]|nr:ribosome-associated translation inhibitor RaiA [Phyllobacteriaceae bacterium]
MSLRVSGKQMEIGEAFRTRIEERISEGVAKYFAGGYSGQITVEKVNGRFSADCHIHLASGMTLEATGQAQEPIAAFEAAAERIDKRLRRYKRRLKSHNAGIASDEPLAMAYRVMEPLADDDEHDVPADYAPTIVAETSMSLKSLSVAAAVIELDARDTPFVVFRNAGNDHINIVYRRPDGNIGWIDPSTAKAKA